MHASTDIGFEDPDAEARFRLTRIFDYVADDVPLNVWPDRDGSHRDLRDLTLGQLERRIATIQTDLGLMGSTLDTKGPEGIYRERALAKLELLHLLYLAKSSSFG